MGTAGVHVDVINYTCEAGLYRNLRGRVSSFAMAPIQSPDAAHSYLDRIHDFVAENRRAILVATAATLIAAGAVYYASSSTRPAPGKGKSKDKKPKKKSVNGSDGPIIEEIKPKVDDLAGLSHRSPSFAGLTAPRTENAPLSPEQIAALPFEVIFSLFHRAPCSSLVASYRNASNRLRPSRHGVTRFTRHASSSRPSTSTHRPSRCRHDQNPCFTAIELHVCLALDLHMRAMLISFAGYMYMSPPQHDRVVADCDDALRQDPNYVKALNRRATALESLNRYEEALRGMSRILF